MADSTNQDLQDLARRLSELGRNVGKFSEQMDDITDLFAEYQSRLRNSSELAGDTFDSLSDAVDNMISEIQESSGKLSKTIFKNHASALEQIISNSLNIIKSGSTLINDDLSAVIVSLSKAGTGMMEAFENFGGDDFKRQVKSIKSDVRDLRSLVSNLNIGQQITEEIQTGILDAKGNAATRTVTHNISGNVSQAELDSILASVNILEKALVDADKMAMKSDAAWKKLAPTIQSALAPLQKIDTLLGKVPLIGESLQKIFNLDGIKTYFNALIKESLITTGKVKPIRSLFKSMFSGIKDGFNAINFRMAIFSGGLILIVGIITKLIDAFGNLYAAQRKIQSETGLMRDQSFELLKINTSVAVEMAKYGVTLDSATQSSISLKKELGSVFLINRDLIADSSVLSAQYNISAESSGKLFKMLNLTSKVSNKTRDHFMGVTRALSESVGLGFNEIVDEMSQNAGVFYKYFKGSRSELLKATVQAKLLGMSLQDIASMSDSILNWDSSIESEMDAAVMLGKNIDLNRARVAAFEGDMSTMTNEILRQAGGLDEFNKMNVIQKEALAKAMGMTVDKLGEVLTKEDMLAKKPELKQKYNDIGKQIADLNKMSAESLVDEQNQLLATARLKAAWSEVEMVLTNLAIKWMPTISSAVDTIANVIGYIADGINAVMSIFPGWSDSTSEVEKNVSGVNNVVTDMKKNVNVVQAGFGNWLVGLTLVGGALGLVINKVMKVGSAIKNSPLGKTVANKLGGLIKTAPVEDAVSKSGKLADAAKKQPLVGNTFVQSMRNLGKGFNALFKSIDMASIGKFALMMAILIASLVGVAFGLKQFIDVPWDAYLKGITSLGALILGVVVISKLASAIDMGSVLKGAIAMAIMGAALIPFAYALSLLENVSWETLAIAGVGILGLTLAVAGLGAIMMSGVGAAAILLGAAALTVMGAALVVFGAGINVLSSGLPTLTDFLEKISTLDGIKLTQASIGIGAVGMALAALGAGQMIQGITSFIGSIFGGGESIFSILERFADNSTKLKESTSAVVSFSNGLSKLNTIHNDGIKNILNDMVDFSNNIETTAIKEFSNSLYRIAKSVESISALPELIKSTADELREISTISMSPSVVSTVKSISSNKNNSANQKQEISSGGDKIYTDDRVPLLLSELISLLKSGAIAVNMDSDRVSKKISSTTVHPALGGKLYDR